jgi:hypothetical protein
VTEVEGVMEASKGVYAVGGVARMVRRPSTAGYLHSRFDMAAAQPFNEVSLSTGPEDSENKKVFVKELTRKI